MGQEIGKGLVGQLLFGVSHVGSYSQVLAGTKISGQDIQDGSLTQLQLMLTIA